MSKYRVVLTAPAVIEIVVEVQSECGADAMADAHVALERLKAGEQVTLHSVDPIGARVLACEKLDEDRVAQAEPSPVQEQPTVEPVQAPVVAPSEPSAGQAAAAPAQSDALSPAAQRILSGLVAKPHTAKFYLDAQAVTEDKPCETLELVFREDAKPFAQRILAGIDERYEMRVFSPTGFMVFKAVNPYGKVALVRFDAPDAEVTQIEGAQSEGWSLFRGWLPDTRAARLAAVEALEAGYVREIGVAVRSDEPEDADKPGRLRVVARFQAE